MVTALSVKEDSQTLVEFLAKSTRELMNNSRKKHKRHLVRVH